MYICTECFFYILVLLYYIWGWTLLKLNNSFNISKLKNKAHNKLSLWAQRRRWKITALRFQSGITGRLTSKITLTCMVFKAVSVHFMSVNVRGFFGNLQQRGVRFNCGINASSKGFLTCCCLKTKRKCRKNVKRHLQNAKWNIQNGRIRSASLLRTATAVWSAWLIFMQDSTGIRTRTPDLPEGWHHWTTVEVWTLHCFDIQHLPYQRQLLFSAQIFFIFYA